MNDLISRQAAIDAIVQCTNCGDEDTLRGYTLKHNLDNGWSGGILEALDAVKNLPTIQPVATDTNTGDKISKFIDDLEKTFAYIREREGGDSVCGLCEYDGAYIGESGDWCNECPGFNRDDCFKLSDETRKKWTDEIITICKHVGNNSEIPNSSDCISRQAALEKVRTMQTYKLFVGDDMILVDKAEVQTELMMLPTAQPERKKGEWIEISSINHTYKCSECGRLLVNITDGKNNVAKNYPYCHCGADMRGESE